MAAATSPAHFDPSFEQPVRLELEPVSGSSAELRERLLAALALPWRRVTDEEAGVS